MTLKLGKAPARPGAVKLKFSNYVNTSVLATPPDSFGHDKLAGNRWGMLANDQVGDCAIADALHQTLLWNLERGIAIPLDDECALKNYAQVTGFTPVDTDGNPWPPEDNPTDQGTDVPDLIKYRATHGLVDAAGNTHKIGAAVALEPGDWEELFYALYYFDGLTLGIQMSQQWMDAFQAGDFIWDAVNSPDIIGGHAITGVAFHNQLARPITWGTDEVNLTEAGYGQASDETYAFFSDEKLRNGVDINGIDKEKLLNDLPLLQDVSTPKAKPRRKTQLQEPHQFPPDPWPEPV